MHEKNHSFTDGRSGAAVTVKVTPRAARDEITGLMDDGTIKVHTRAISAEEDANASVVALFGRRLRVPESKIEIVAGHNRNQKLLAIEGLTAEEVESRLGLT